MALLLLMALLLGLNHWLLEPALQVLSHGLELRILPWVLLVGLAWVLSGESSQG